MKMPSGSRRRELLAHLLTSDGEPRADLNDAPPLSSADVAVLFQMSERAIRFWAAKGHLPHIRSLGGGRLLYPADQIAALYVQRYMDVALRQPGAAVSAVESTRISQT